MSKKYRSQKKDTKLFERIFIALLALVVVAVIALVVVTIMPQQEAGGYVVTSDGHVHDAAGNHLGDYDEMVANGTFIVTSDGHVHDAAGNHIDVPEALLAADEHVHTEDEAAAE
ncbi:MAG: hypothetical protein IJE07_05935 [Clostridia bacterium]|nr:hypothetical protein [Clostridia bacterium]